jgi:hypothetical protein
MITQAQEARLIADISLANNGYLVEMYMTPAMHRVALELQLEGKVQITNGVVHLPRTVPEFFKTPLPTKAFPLRHDGPDYEAMILDRQAREGFCD